MIGRPVIWWAQEDENMAKREAKVYSGSPGGLQNEINQITDSNVTTLVDVKVAAEPSQGQAGIVAVIIFDKN